MNNGTNPDTPDINPTTGLPMVEDTYIDVGGNPYGTDVYPWQPPLVPVPDPFQPPNFDGW